MTEGIEQRWVGHVPMVASGLRAVVWAAPRLGEPELSTSLGGLPEHTSTLAVLLG